MLYFRPLSEIKAVQGVQLFSDFDLSGQRHWRNAGGEGIDWRGDHCPSLEWVPDGQGHV